MVDADEIRRLKEEIKQLRQDKQELLEIIRRSPVLFWKLDNDGRFTLSKGGALKTLQLEEDMVVGMSVFDVYKDFPEVLEHHQIALNGKEDSRLLSGTGAQYVDGEKEVYNVYMWSTTFPTYVDGKQIGTLGVASDISDFKRTEDKLLETERKYRTLFQNSPIGIFIVQDTRIIDVNPAGVKVFGYDSKEELVGRSGYDLLSIDEWGRMRAEAKKVEGDINIPPKYDTIGRRKDGSEFPMRIYASKAVIDGEPVAISFNIDLSVQTRLEKEKEEVERQLFNAQKLESLGVLSGGIAHDFNNFLMAILGNTELAMSMVDTGSKIEEYLHSIVEICKSARLLTKELLMLSGSHPQVVSSVDIAELIRGMDKVLSVAVPKNVMMEYELCESCNTLVDSYQIQQVILNLVINARDAIGDSSGKIRLELSVGGFENNNTVLLDPGSSVKTFAKIEVRDTGSGISGDILSRICDPFFSTKSMGRGLGLSVVRSILQKHNAGLTVNSEEGKGTSFCIYLPMTDRATDTFPETIPIENLSGRVLFADDDNDIRRVISAHLHNLGLEVSTAANGEEALALFDLGKYDLILLDLTMPVMTGLETYGKIRAIDPDVPIVLSSGFSQEKIDHLNDDNTYFLMKPYTISELVLIFSMVLM